MPIAGRSGRCDLVASATYRPTMLLRFCLAPARRQPRINLKWKDWTLNLNFCIIKKVNFKSKTGASITTCLMMPIYSELKGLIRTDWFHFETKKNHLRANKWNNFNPLVTSIMNNRREQVACVQIRLFFSAHYAMNSYGMGSSSCGAFFLVLTKWASRGGAGCTGRNIRFTTDRRSTCRNENILAQYVIQWPIHTK